jgi:hypothetical protein
MRGCFHVVWYIIGSGKPIISLDYGRHLQSISFWSISDNFCLISYNFYFRFLKSLQPSMSVTYSKPTSTSLHASSRFFR